MDMVSMESEPGTEAVGVAMPACSPYPYGLRLHLTQVELGDRAERMYAKGKQPA